MSFRNRIFLYLIFLLVLNSCRIFKHDKTTTFSQSQKLDITSEFVDGCKEKILGNYDKAITSFLSCIKIDPSNASALYELAGIYYLQKKDKDAMPLIEKAVKLEPDNVWFQLLNANLLINENKYKEATAIYEKLAKVHPENIEYFFDWAQGCLYMGKLTDAIGVYDIIEEKTGVNEDISLQKEKIYIQLKKTDKAIEEIQKLVNAFPSEISYLNYLADLYLSFDMTSKAYEIYQKIITINPEDANVHLSLAGYYRKIGNYEKSFDELKLAFSNENLDIDAKVKILLSYYALTEKSDDLIEQAYKLINILIETHPDDAKAYSIYGDFLYRDKKFEEAKNQYLKVISLDSSKYVIWEQLLLLESELKNNTALESESKRAIELFPEQAPLYLFNGVSNYLLKKYDDAIIALNKGIALVISDNDMLIQLYTYLGDSYYAKQNFKNAFSSYDKVLILDPKNTYILNNYSYYLALLGENLDKAEKMAKKVVDIVSDNSSYLDTYGWVLYKKEKYSDAEIWIKKAIDNGGDSNSVILEHYGDVVFRLGNIDKAIEYWEKAKAKGKGSGQLDKKISEKKIYE